MRFPFALNDELKFFQFSVYRLILICFSQEMPNTENNAERKPGVVTQSSNSLKKHIYVGLAIIFGHSTGAVIADIRACASIT